MRKTLTLLFWLLLVGYFAYSKFFYVDRASNCFVTIIPSFLPGNLNTKEAILILKNGAPDEYDKFCRYVSVIDKNPSCGGANGGCFREDKPRKIFIGNDQGNPAIAASIIVHETCHAIQGHEGRPFKELECYNAGSKVVEELTIF